MTARTFLFAALAAAGTLAHATILGTTAGTSVEPRPGATAATGDPGARRAPRILRRIELAAAGGHPVLAPADRPRAQAASTPAHERDTAAPGAGAPQPAARLPVARTAAPLVVVRSAGPGQDGYVHFFLIETPEGETETQLGIELPDGRIAWSFPGVGVSLVPFIQDGTLEANGRRYAIRHLYGLRPFPDEDGMQSLRNGLQERATRWAGTGTPYCNPFLRSEQLCLSCLGFVLQILFPGPTPAFPAMPPRFPRTQSRLFYTSDDLLLYLTGQHEIATAMERFRRIESLELPEYLREELFQLVDATDLRDSPGPVITPRMKNAAEPARKGVRSYSRTAPQRKRL